MEITLALIFGFMVFMIILNKGHTWLIPLFYAVALSVTFKGSGGFLGLSDKEDTVEMTVALVKEHGKWKVCDWD